MKLILTSLLYLSCLRKYSAILLIKFLHSGSFSYDPDWNFTLWSFSGSIFKVCKGTSLKSNVMCYIVKFDQCFSLKFGHFSKTWACCWIHWHFMNYLFRMCRATELAYSWFFSFTIHFKLFKLAVLLTKVMFVWGISFSFSSCNLQIVKIIFCHNKNLLPKARETFFFHLLIVESFGIFFFVHFNLDNTGFNFQNVKESLQQFFKD